MDFSTLLNWLDTFKTWITDTLTGLLHDLINVGFDMFIWLVDKLFFLVFSVLALLPAPDLTGSAFTFGVIASGLPSAVLYIMTKIQLAKAFSILVAGYSFYFVRRLFTLGIW